jgi:hypothetical protein
MKGSLGKRGLWSPPWPGHWLESSPREYRYFTHWLPLSQYVEGLFLSLRGEFEHLDPPLGDNEKTPGLVPLRKEDLAPSEGLLHSYLSYLLQNLLGRPRKRELTASFEIVSLISP